jgi:hypothetical protein
MVAGTLTVANRLNVCPFQLSPRRRPITTRPIVLNVDNERQSKRDQERLQTIDADLEERLVED